MESLLPSVEVLYKFRDTAGVLEFGVLCLPRLCVGRTLVCQSNREALVEEGEFSQTLRQRVVVVLDGREDVFVRQEMHLRAALLRGAGLLECCRWDSFGVRLFPNETVAPDLEIELMRKAVDDAHADAVKTA